MLWGGQPKRLRLIDLGALNTEGPESRSHAPACEFHAFLHHGKDCVSFFKGLPPRQIELLSSAIVEESAPGQSRGRGTLGMDHFAVGARRVS